MKSTDDIPIKFNDSLEVKYTEERLVPVSDNIYQFRITAPTENFSINYSMEGCHYDLVGNGFGTFQNTRDGGINIYKDGNSIHITTKRWLLTGNGIIIVQNELIEA